MTQGNAEMRTVTAVVQRVATITDVVVVDVPADTHRYDLDWAIEAAVNGGEGEWQDRQRISFGDEAWELSPTETPDRYVAELAAIKHAVADTEQSQQVWVLEMAQPDDKCLVIGVYDTEQAATARLAGELTELWPTYLGVAGDDMYGFPWQTMFADHAAWCEEVIDRFTAAQTGVEWHVVDHPINPATPTCGSW